MQWYMTRMHFNSSTQTYTPKARNGTLYNHFITAFVKHERQCCHCWTPDDSKEVTIVSTGRNVNKVTFLRGTSLYQNLSTN